jgi:hypothetical protein
LQASASRPSELERLMADLSQSGLLVYVVGVGWWKAHLTCAAAPLFRGPVGGGDVELRDEAANWSMAARVDQITGVRFTREPYPFLRTGRSMRRAPRERPTSESPGIVRHGSTPSDLGRPVTVRDGHCDVNVNVGGIPDGRRLEQLNMMSGSSLVRSACSPSARVADIPR